MQVWFLPLKRMLTPVHMPLLHVCLMPLECLETAALLRRPTQVSVIGHVCIVTHLCWTARFPAHLVWSSPCSWWSGLPSSLW